MAAMPPLPVAERTAHPFLTHDMIHEIPASLRETLRRNDGPAREAADGLDGRRFLFFTGCGTASFAAMLAERFAAAAEGDRLRSSAVPGLELSGYTPRVDASCGVVGVSHSGITKATVDALGSARGRGARTIGITHFADRPIAATSDATLIAGNGPDLSRCHTKCYVAGAAAGALVALEWRGTQGQEPRGPIDAQMESLRQLPRIQEALLRSLETACADLARAHLERKATLILGSGPNVPTALETALKLKETSFIAAEGMEIEQFLHGSWQILDSDSLVFVAAPKGPSHARAVDLLRAAKTVGAHTVAVGNEGDREVEATAETVLFTPEVDELLSPFLNIIPLYLYAYHASVLRGHNPDLLRYLEPRYWAARQIVFPPGTH